MEISRIKLLQYGLIALPMAFCGLPLYIYSPDFYVTEYGLSLTTLAYTLFALRFFDAIQDPILGKLSDKYKQQRSTIAAASLITMALSFWALFNPIEGYTTLWFATFMLLSTSAYSLLAINITAIGGLIHGNKVKIAAYREGLGVIGLILAVLLPPILATSMNKQDSFNTVAYTLITLSTISLYYWYKFSKTGLKFEKSSLKAKTKISKKARLLSAYFISASGSALAAVLVLFYIRDYLNLEAYTGLFLAIYFGCALSSMALWQKIAHHKPQTYWRLSITISCLTFLGAYLVLEPGNLIAYSAICAITGFMLGAELIIPPALMAKDLPEKNASTFYAAMSFLNKSALAIASIIAFLTLDASNFEATQINDDQSMQTLHLLYTALPAILKSLSLIILRRPLP